MANLANNNVDKVAITCKFLFHQHHWYRSYGGSVNMGSLTWEFPCPLLLHPGIFWMRISLATLSCSAILRRWAQDIVSPHPPRIQSQVSRKIARAVYLVLFASFSISLGCNFWRKARHSAHYVDKWASPDRWRPYSMFGSYSRIVVTDCGNIRCKKKFLAITVNAIQFCRYRIDIKRY